MKYFLSILFFVLMGKIQAQNNFWVPDSNFRTALKVLYPTCFTASDSLIISCAASKTGALNVPYRNISNIDGFQYFTSIVTFSCNNNQINNIPILSSSLKELIVNNNLISNLPLLPTNLTKLNCSFNQLTSIPSLPSTLTYLDISLNQLSSIPVLPTSLISFYCNGLQLSSQISNLTLPNLEVFECESNLLTALPTLPSTLKKLSCDFNSMSSLPIMPNSLTDLSCSDNQLTSLTLPTNLQTLYCPKNLLTNINNFPNSMRYLNCTDNLLTTLPTLPNSITSIYCDNNQLTSLPNFPTSLTYITCSNNQLTTLPIMSNLITGIDCSRNLLTSIPNLSTKLSSLNCKNNHLTSLPTLPNLLKSLQCEYNQLTSLPVLPNNLEWLTCNNNFLTSIPTLPSTIVTLFLFNNRLTSLPLGYNFNYINIENNLFTSIPYLSSNINSLMCNGNPIVCLPVLPDYIDDNNPGIQTLHLPSTVTCLPNLPNSLYYLKIDTTETVVSTFPICNVNTTTCEYSSIDGNVYLDFNNDGIKNGSDYFLDNHIVSSTPNNYVTLTNSSGNYSQVVSPSTYKVTPFSNPSFTAFPDTQVVTVSAFNTVFANFRLVPNGSIHDVRLVQTISNIRPGLDFYIHLTLFNDGNLPENGTITLILPNNVSFVNANSTPSIAGQSLTFSYSNLLPLNSIHFNIICNNSVSNIVGTSLSFNANTNLTNDNTPINNSDNQSVIVSGSFDPNNKEVVPNTPIDTVFVNAGKYLDYTINFQNTGNDTAFKVVLQDTLSQFLDYSTFELLGYSHNVQYNLYSKGYLTFIFNNIILPDSFSNEPKSHGYVRYRIKPKSTMPLGSIISNTAHIYFDYNSPIVTNTTSTHYYNSTSIIPFSQSSFNIFPNPAQNYLTITGKLENVKEIKIEIFNLLGLKLNETNEIVNTSNFNKEIDIKNLESGIYIVKVTCGNESFNYKIVKIN